MTQKPTSCRNCSGFALDLGVEDKIDLGDHDKPECGKAKVKTQREPWLHLLICSLSSRMWDLTTGTFIVRLDGCTGSGHESRVSPSSVVTQGEPALGSYSGYSGGVREQCRRTICSR